ncbi:ABC transporter permease [Vallitalea okinawensis]|uniref:ABC transporter permease n=1 Tax=Vallitalea okinawensis TaxID=2078660 RepID=UPI000CFD3120|nr:ABC transporter permease [Vallitalea okinawensis]
MIARIRALIKKEFILGSKNYFTAVIIATAIMFALIIRFVIPEDMSHQATIFFAVDQQVLDSFGTLLEDDQQVLESRDAIIEAMEANINSVGVYLTLMNDTPEVELILQGHESKSMVELYKLSIRRQMKTMYESDEESWEGAYSVQLLKDYNSEPNIPFNHSMIPLFILFESTLVGFVMIATLIFSEKEERTELAFAITPGRIGELLVSKAVFIAVLGLVSCCIITIPTVGLKGSFSFVLLLVFVGNIFGSSIGLLIASFFKDLSKSMVWIILLSLILSAPMISYFVPAYNPTWLKIIPTYPLMYALKEAYFPTGNTSMIINTLGVFLLLDVVVFFITSQIFSRRLVKG